MQHTLLRTLGAIGCLIYIPLFIFTFSDPQLIEKSGKSFIEWKLTTHVHSKIESITLPKTTKMESLLGLKAKALRIKTEEKIRQLKANLKADAPSIISKQLIDLRNVSCTCRKNWEKSLKKSLKIELASLEIAKSKLIDFTQTKYMEIVTKLTLDIRIFLGVNSIVFLFLLLISFFKPRAINHLFLPSTLLFISTVACSYFYVFEQNWFYTIIYSNYTGYNFIAYLVIVFAFLCDITFNKGKVTTEIINGIFQVIGKTAANLVPC